MVQQQVRTILCVPGPLIGEAQRDFYARIFTNDRDAMDTRGVRCKNVFGSRGGFRRILPSLMTRRSECVFLEWNSMPPTMWFCVHSLWFAVTTSTSRCSSLWLYEAANCKRAERSSCQIAVLLSLLLGMNENAHAVAILNIRQPRTQSVSDCSNAHLFNIYLVRGVPNCNLRYYGGVNIFVLALGAQIFIPGEACFKCYVEGFKLSAHVTTALYKSVNKT